MRHDFGPLGPFSRLLDWVGWLCAVAAGGLMVVLIAIFGWLVWGRYVMNDTPTWVEQAALMMIVWITFLGAAVGVRNGAHLSIDFLREAFPRPLRGLCVATADLAMVGFGLIMAWQGALLMQSTFDRAVPMLGISEGWRAFPVALCGGLSAVFAFENLIGLWRGGRGLGG